VITVKDLMISVNGYLKVMVCKALVQVEQEWSELNCRITFFEDLLQALFLDLAL